MSCADDAPRPHVVFHDDHFWTEGGGAKWRFAKYSLWFALRLRQLAAPIAVAWMPNPAQMQNPQMSERLPSMMGGLGILRPDALPPVLANRSAAWLRERIERGEYRRVDVPLEPGGRNTGAEQTALAAMTDAHDARPIAYFLTGPAEPMHWHGAAG
eukprot:7151630-Prymnesium_polylepis.1